MRRLIATALSACDRAVTSVDPSRHSPAVSSPRTNPYAAWTNADTDIPVTTVPVVTAVPVVVTTVPVVTVASNLNVNALGHLYGLSLSRYGADKLRSSYQHSRGC